MLTVRAVIVDDERPARLRLRQLIETTAGLDAVGEAADADTAVTLICASRPDLVFLDMELPNGGGLRVARALGSEMPVAIFVTAHQQFAVPAFDLGAVDYLLKPFDDPRFALAVNRARTRIEQRATAQVAPTLVVRERGQTRRVPLGSVRWVEARDQYSVLHLASGEEAWMRTSLRELEVTLGRHGFVRVHRSAIIDVARLRTLHRRSHGDFEVELFDGTRIRASRTFRARVLAALQGHSCRGLGHD